MGNIEKANEARAEKARVRKAIADLHAEYEAAGSPGDDFEQYVRDIEAATAETIRRTPVAVDDDGFLPAEYVEGVMGAAIRLPRRRPPEGQRTKPAGTAGADGHLPTFRLDNQL